MSLACKCLGIKEFLSLEESECALQVANAVGRLPQCFIKGTIQKVSVYRVGEDGAIDGLVCIVSLQQRLQSGRPRAGKHDNH